MHIALIGATGLVGSNLLEKLLANPRLDKITTISRRPLERSESQLNQLVLSKMSPDHIATMSVKADIFVCALGTTIKAAGSEEAFRAVDYDLVVAFARLAKKEQGKAFFVVSALGSDSSSMIFYNKVKGETEEAIISLDLPSTYILRPSLLIGNREEKRTAEAIGIKAYKLLSPFLPDKIKSRMGTEVDDIVAYIERVLFHIKPGVHKISQFSK